MPDIKEIIDFLNSIKKMKKNQIKNMENTIDDMKENLNFEEPASQRWFETSLNDYTHFIRSMEDDISDINRVLAMLET